MEDTGSLTRFHFVPLRHGRRQQRPSTAPSSSIRPSLFLSFCPFLFILGIGKAGGVGGGVVLCAAAGTAAAAPAAAYEHRPTCKGLSESAQ